jgi:hypothetical protein
MTTLHAAIANVLESLGTWPSPDTTVTELQALEAAGHATPISGDDRARLAGAPAWAA